MPVRRGSDSATGFAAAARAFADLLDHPDVGARWDEPSALGGYSLGDLVAHVHVAVAWLEPLLDTSVDDDTRPTRLGRYYAGMKVTGPEDLEGPFHGAVRAMSAAGAAKGADKNVERLRSLLDRLAGRLAGEDPERVLDLRPALPIVMHQGDFTATRVLELVVHGDDLATSLGVEWRPPAEAADVALDALVATARAEHGDVAVLRAMARRERVGEGVFPVL